LLIISYNSTSTTKKILELIYIYIFKKFFNKNIKKKKKYISICYENINKWNNIKNNNDNNNKFKFIIMIII